jgi:hypothetical protein
VGGLANGAERVFPNAIVRADKHDADFWLSHANLDKAAADAKGFFQGAMASLKPYVDAGKFQPFEGNTDLVPGIKAVATHGHTLGHAVFVAESKGREDRLLGRPDARRRRAVGRAGHHHPVRHRQQGRRQAAHGRLRRRRKARLHRRGLAPFVPRLGRLRAEGKGYRFIPLNYVSR